MRSSVTFIAPWLIGAALYVIAFAVLSWGGYDRQPATVVGGLLLLIVAARLLRNGLVVAPRGVRIGAPAAMIVAGAGLVAYWFLGTPTGGWGVAGLCAFFLGLGHAVTVWREGDSWKLRRGLVLLVGLGIVAAAGVVLCLAVNAWWLIATAVALLLMPIGITLLSEDLLPEDPRWPWWWSAAGGALVAIAVVWLALRTDMTPTLAIAVGAGAIVLMAAIASNTQADVLLIVLVAAVAWLGVPRGVDRVPSVEPRAEQPAVVALGDSYMSGEGAKTFFVGTNDPARPNECRRSRTAYAHLTVAHGGIREYDHLAFYACSGALAKHIHAEAQHKGEPLDDTPGHGLNQLEQLRNLRERRKVDLKLVIVSIGGNDAGFSSIGTACVAPGSCVELGQRWLDGLPGVAAKVKTAFGELRRTLDKLQPGVPVLVIPYPVPIRETGCDYSSLGDDEHRFVHGFVSQLNGAIRTVARESGFYVLEEMERAFGTTLRICDGPLSEIGENFIAPASVEGVLDQAMNPRNWIHNSFHPNERGHAAMSRELAAWIALHPEPAGVPGAGEQASPFEPASLEEIMGSDVAHCGGEDEPSYCDRAATPWAITQLGVLATQIAIPALLLAVGAWAIAMGGLVRYRRWRRFPSRALAWALEFLKKPAPRFVITGVAVGVGLLGLWALSQALTPVIALLILTFAVVATSGRVAQCLLLLACAAVVALLTLVGFNVALGVVLRLFDNEARLPIWLGLIFAVLVFGGGAYFYLIGTWQDAAPPFKWLKNLQTKVREKLKWAGLSPGWTPGQAGAGAAGLSLFVILVVPILATELRERPDPDRVPATEIGRGLDVLLVTDPPPPPSSATEVREELLGEREAADIRFSVARAGEDAQVTWTLPDETDVATVGRFLTAKAAPAKSAPTLRPRADAAVVLVAASTDRPGRWASVKRAVEDDVGPGLPVYVLLVGPVTDAWENSPAFDAVASLGDGEAVTDAAVHLSNTFPAGIEHFGLALTHRPVLLFDAKEPVPRPLSIERLFDNRAVRQCPDDESGGECGDVIVRNPARLTSPGTHLDIVEQDDLDVLAKRERTAFSQGLKALEGRPLGDGSRIYVNTVEAGDWLYLDYWWYLQHNPTGAGRGAFCGAGFVIAGVTCFDHVSDWEGVTVVLKRSGDAWEPDRVHYAQHESVVRYPWDALGAYWSRTRFADRDEDRPLVFVARGTHAAYPHPCDGGGCRQVPADLEETDHDGGLEWVANNTELCLVVECLRTLPTASGGRGPASWNAFRGSWGTRRCILKYYCDLATPPGAPGGQERYLNPAHSDGRADPSDPDGGYDPD